MRKNNKARNAIGIDYLEQILNYEDIQEIQNDLAEVNITLITKSHRAKYIAGIEDFFAQVSIFLSPEIIQGIQLGLVTNGIYDILKTFIFKIYSKIKQKTFSKIQKGEIINGITPTVHLVVGKNHIILPMELDDEKFKYCIDKIFETSNQNVTIKECYTKYDKESENFISYTKEQIVRTAYENWKETNEKRQGNDD